MSWRALAKLGTGFSSGSMSQPIWVPWVRQWRMLRTTLVWLWPGERMSITQSGAIENGLATSPDASRGMQAQVNGLEVSSGFAPVPAQIRSNGLAVSIAPSHLTSTVRSWLSNHFDCWVNGLAHALWIASGGGLAPPLAYVPQVAC